MDAPKCRTCGDRHWGLCSPGAPVAPPKVAKAVIVKPVEVTASTYQHRDPAARRPYMAAYMREWRAKRKLRTNP